MTSLQVKSESTPLTVDVSSIMPQTMTAEQFYLAGKTYAASANYINMSDYYKGCQYSHKARIGEDACLFNFFYWDFLAHRRENLSQQGRMDFILNNL